MRISQCAGSDDNNICNWNSLINQSRFIDFELHVPPLHSLDSIQPWVIVSVNDEENKSVASTNNPPQASNPSTHPSFFSTTSTPLWDKHITDNPTLLRVLTKLSKLLVLNAAKQIYSDDVFHLLLSKYFMPKYKTRPIAISRVLRVISDGQTDRPTKRLIESRVRN